MIVGAYRFPRQDAVIYGQPAADAIRAEAQRLGVKRVLVLTTRSLADAGARDFCAALGPLCVGMVSEIAAHSPRTDVIAAAQRARELDADFLVAFGGGSVIDATKVVQICLWAGLTRPGELDPWRRGQGPDRRDPATLAPGIRMAAVPTTLSAAEFTPFAGVSDAVRNVKEGYTHPDLAPRVVVLDPAVTLATPPRLWASTGIKAVDHAVEQLSNLQRSPMADAAGAEGLRLLASGLPASLAAPGDIELRAACQHGMWLAISGSAAGRGMGASHAIGHTLGGSYGVPHGITSCVTLHAVLAWNAGADQGRQRVISAQMGRPDAPASQCVRDLVASLGLPTRLSDVGVPRSAFQAIAEHTMHDRGVRTNPRPIGSPSDIIEILELAA